MPVDDGHGPAFVALLFGTQFPDLVDKPLAWTVAVLPSGRSLAHSVFALAVVFGVAWWATGRSDRRTYTIGFGIGYASHLFADSVQSLVGLEFEYLTFLAWPLLAPPPYELDSSFSAHFANLNLTAWLWLEFLLVGVALAVAVWTEYGVRIRSA
ncbi:LexA-binding, inner membrane-associated putative hydrolase [Haloarchaeobius iranensis]|uniref:LexA-binding, inner membrane-associated putative hydrolase n=2 Tax=Haloarchaeobius iranensis TaxID=996166 RepID=A0A1H0ADK2_9EURY|nr:LexA-binding, inner membrane-associated putative hydrolase [Haloarchaeobius iranensis]